MDSLASWKVPFDGYAVRCLVKSYLDAEKKNIWHFKNNFPGSDWLQSFIKRHKLTKRITDNVKSSRALVTEEVINKYFDHLENSIKDIPASNIFNYDETNITDNPGAKLVITRRGRNRVERIMHHSKSSISVMFAGRADGHYLPPMVVYKAENIYKEWCRAGPIDTVYSCTKSGWFDIEQFEMWFFKQFVPSTSDLVGPIVLIGDNLGSHFSKKVLQYCDENEIRFLCLPPNSTHFCQPLDVAVFRPAKAEWRDILDNWRKESRCADNLPKTIFPSLLYKLFRRLKPENLVSGFRATGIVPLERNEILKRLPGTNDTTNVQEFSFNQSVLDVLKENCGVGQKKREKRKRGKRIEPGKRVGANDFLSEDKENEKPTSSKWKARKESFKKSR